MTRDEFNKEFQKVIDEASKYWDSDMNKKLFKEYSNENGKISLPDMCALLRDQSAQYTNQLVYNALTHFLIDDSKENPSE